MIQEIEPLEQAVLGFVEKRFMFYASRNVPGLCHQIRRAFTGRTGTNRGA
jgi:hypothetical protein